MHDHEHDETGKNNAAAATIIAALGVILITLVATGQLTNYVRPYFRPIMFITGVCLISLGGWTLVNLRRHFTAITHDKPLRRTSWLMLVPILLAVLCAPSPLGAAMLNSSAVGGVAGDTGQREPRIVNRVGRNPDGTIAYPPLATGEVNEITLEDLANRYTFGTPKNLEGKKVKLVGFAAPGGPGREAWRLSRFKIYCCAADSIPYTAAMQPAPTATGVAAGVPKADQWLEVTGTVKVTPGVTTPTVIVEQATEIKQPSVPYL